MRKNKNKRSSKLKILSLNVTMEWDVSLTASNLSLFPLVSEEQLQRLVPGPLGHGSGGAEGGGWSWPLQAPHVTRGVLTGDERD